MNSKQLKFNEDKLAFILIICYFLMFLAIVFELEIISHIFFIIIIFITGFMMGLAYALSILKNFIEEL